MWWFCRRSLFLVPHAHRPHTCVQIEHIVFFSALFLFFFFSIVSIWILKSAFLLMLHFVCVHSRRLYARVTHVSFKLVVFYRDFAGAEQIIQRPGKPKWTATCRIKEKKGCISSMYRVRNFKPLFGIAYMLALSACRFILAKFTNRNHNNNNNSNGKNVREIDDLCLCVHQKWPSCIFYFTL